MDEVAKAVLAMAWGAEIITHRETAWARATFSGVRHEFDIGFFEPSDGEEFVERLPDHEFAISGLLVADAQIIQIRDTPTEFIVTAHVLALNP